MKYLKIFENFVSDYKEGYEKIKNDFEKKKQEHFNKFKSIVDEYLYDITDYNLINDISYLEKNIEIKYELEVPFENIELFINDLKTAEKRLSEDLNLNLSLHDMVLEYDISIGGVRSALYHQINFGHKSSIKDLVDWLNNYNNLKEDVKIEYINLSLIICIK